ncbi:ABC transporter substrate-binding protein [Pectobacterium fontis]|uniref:ABC transporter substrate-binding protein n=1 Tax=Pectobacterium fontis TaxID=2558042 RepID=A0A7V8IKK6_9GAMM|nr:ABC transporter substrate-binding protein [Pectobacterium fontis]KHN53993.1 ABC transporter substrate-binding protein [Pectobacterium fontis]
MRSCRLLLFWLINFLALSPLWANELVIATTFSPETTANIMSQWQRQSSSVPVRTLNRTSSSLERLMGTPLNDSIDLILTSSPMLMQHLQDHQLLSPIPAIPPESQRLVPDSIRGSAAAIAISGFGILANATALQEKKLSPPDSWEQLKDPRYQSLILMSSPSRSDTSHLMIETLLQQQGWQQGWAMLMEISGNLATISSRSFGVASKITTGLGMAGPIIDNYATPLLKDPHLVFRYIPHAGAAPTFIAITRNSTNKDLAMRFIYFLLSKQGQKILSDTDTGKFPVFPLPEDNPRAQQQYVLLQSPPPDYRLILLRQKLVQRLFDTAITFRLNQSQDIWKTLHNAESQLNRPLPEIRALLTEIPVTAQQADDVEYLKQFNQLENDIAPFESNLIEWQQFFQHQHQQALQKLEAIR